jgi:hypothetical protein
MLLVHSILGRFLLPYWDISFVHLNKPFPKPNLGNDRPIPSEGDSTMTKDNSTRMDLGIQYRMKGDDIVIYPYHKVTRVAGIKHKYWKDYDPTFSD